MKSSSASEESTARSLKYSPESAQAKELNHAVTYNIAKYSMPISVVERPGFKRAYTVKA